ncbi:villin-3-like isoform X2 [Salvia miltiorrhiza]|uniref:villin-3-like isoform X2 n=1 Tax=Salvia miltiorrhiza TaxID=226208 RepID=UPI0025AC3140|nr:villin-3-like isoform X2 [Salvia miltiorrhiza]XP_057809186.1 villin-3-like isoform X2 [Salvia miltiorrhiza]XP_057809187.1 villin-3-like isoform X2 [Salvia miltiorrhiza]
MLEVHPHLLLEDSALFRLLVVVSNLKFKFQLKDDGKLQAETASGEFWVLFGGFAPIGKKVATEDDIIPEKTPAKLFSK